MKQKKHGLILSSYHKQKIFKRGGAGGRGSYFCLIYFLSPQLMGLQGWALCDPQLIQNTV